MPQKIDVIAKNDWPESLLQIPETPEILYYTGHTRFKERKENKDWKYVCVVGARKYSSYGKDVCEYIIEGLRGLPITIVSGLALGIDSVAHEAAIRNEIHTIAIPGSGLKERILYPKQNIRLARNILKNGGALISEFEPDFVSTVWAFPKRNRIMAGLCDLVIIIEATKESGSLITARLALDYNKTVCTVPGSIFSKNSEGPHYLLKQGAVPISHSDDIKDILGFSKDQNTEQVSLFTNLTDDQTKIIDILSFPMTKSELIGSVGWPVYKTQIVLMELEIKGLIKELYGHVRRTN